MWNNNNEDSSYEASNLFKTNHDLFLEDYPFDAANLINPTIKEVGTQANNLSLSC